MDIAIAFWTALVATVLLMMAALVSGLLGARRLHLWLGPLTMLGLLVAVVLALRLGRVYAFPPGPMLVHRCFAISAGLVALAVAYTGMSLRTRPDRRRWHRRCVLVFVALALGATATGAWIWSLAEPR